MDRPYYDPDEEPRSPGLEISKVDYEAKDSPPPFLQKGSDSDTTKKPADEGTSHDCSRKHQLQPSKPSTTEGNSVLISYLDPNRQDIAAFERNHPLSEDLRREDDLDLPKKYVLSKPEPPSATDESLKLAQSALNLLSDKEPSKPDEVPPPPLPLVGIGNGPDSPPKNKLVIPSLLSPDHDSHKREPDSPQCLQKSLSPCAPEAKPVGPHSPLSRFVIPASEASAHDLLPALHSPDNNHTLPSIQTALGLPSVSKEPPGRPNGSSPLSLPPVTAASPPALRSEPVWEQQRSAPFCPQVPPSPYSHWSPASTNAGNLSAVSSPASQNSHWRSLKSEISYLTSPYDAHSTAKNPATGYPTPTDQTPASTCDRTPYNPPAQSSGANVSTGTFKCAWQGCTAPPFQTQYLLNSHANVHSQERPHFCSVEGCPRGPGGKGFKRKNEMIRHGLVHNSPGYVCPFCPDQQHKYPRPDNLQRHVRVHHVDKSKDDPALRHVLSQRPEGSVRGRRRRQSVQ